MIILNLLSKKFMYFANTLRANHIIIDTRELFRNLHQNGEFTRYDSIVRILAIENYYNINDFGFNFYSRMQCRRLGISDVSYYIDNFKRLINSYELNGYNNNKEIILDKNLTIIDGSHRFALALYYNTPFISAKVFPFVKGVSYGIDWFESNEFNSDECLIIKRKYKCVKENMEPHPKHKR